LIALPSTQSLERLKKRTALARLFTETEWERDERADPRPPEQHAGEGDEWVHEQLLRLDPPHRAVVVMRVVNDCTVDETARALGIPPGTVMSRLSRALDKLRAGLAPGDKEKDK
jgi:RNA polymerase sigma-70 factor (ECF subfamily)